MAAHGIIFPDGYKKSLARKKNRSSRPLILVEIGSSKYAKNKRYTAKMRNSGKCAHCGKESYPYTECRDRREKKRLSRQVKMGYKQDELNTWRLYHQLRREIKDGR